MRGTSGRFRHFCRAYSHFLPNCSSEFLPSPQVILYYPTHVNSLTSTLLGLQVISSSFCCFSERGIQPIQVSCDSQGSAVADLPSPSEVILSDLYSSRSTPAPSDHCQKEACLQGGDASTFTFVSMLDAVPASVLRWADLPSINNSESRTLTEKRQFADIRLRTVVLRE